MFVKCWAKKIKVITNIPHSKVYSKGKVHKNRQNRKEAQPYHPAEQLENNCHIPDLVQAFSEENVGLNQVLRCSKPSTSMTVANSSVYKNEVSYK